MKAKLEDGSSVLSWKKEPSELRKLSDSGRLSCNMCDTKLTFVNSVNRIKHFRHGSDVDCFTGEENKVHDWMKFKIAEWLKNLGLEYELEKKVTFEGLTFLIDVYCPNYGGVAIAIEVQNKHRDVDVSGKSRVYRKLGMVPWWIFYGGNWSSKDYTNFSISDRKHKSSGSRLFFRDIENFMSMVGYNHYNSEFRIQGLCREPVYFLASDGLGNPVIGIYRFHSAPGLANHKDGWCKKFLSLDLLELDFDVMAGRALVVPFKPNFEPWMFVEFDYENFGLPVASK